jgi:hypothetical protein
LRPANPGRAEEAIGFRIIAAESGLLSPNMRPVVGFWIALRQGWRLRRLLVYVVETQTVRLREEHR